MPEKLLLKRLYLLTALIASLWLPAVRAGSNVFYWGQAVVPGDNITNAAPPDGFQTPLALAYFSDRNITVVRMRTTDTTDTRWAITDLGHVYVWGRHPLLGRLTRQQNNLAPAILPDLVGQAFVVDIVNGFGDLTSLVSFYFLLRNGSLIAASLDSSQPRYRLIDSNIVLKQICTVECDQATLALADDGRVFAWGSDTVGLLGNGPATNLSMTLEDAFNNPIPFFVNNGLSVKQIACSRVMFAALTTTDKLYIWGHYFDYYHGPCLRELPGFPADHIFNEPVLADMTENMTVSRIFDGGLGAAGTLFLDENSTLWCCDVHANSAIRLAGIPDGSTIDEAATARFASYVVASGVLYSMGHDDLGQTGASPQVIPLTTFAVVPYFIGNPVSGLAANIVGDFAFAFTSPPCPPDTSSPACYQCHPGTYSDTSAASMGVPARCVTCPTGTKSDQFGQANCTVCEAGTYAPVIGSTRCLPCAAGTTSSPGQAECASCLAGTASGIAAPSCLPCPAGTMSGPAASSCLACLGGYVSPPHASNCTACGAGRYGSTLGVGNCTSCPLGTYSNTTAATSSVFCLACLGQASTPTVASTGPEACQCVENALISSISGLCVCAAGFTPLATPNVGCTPCGDGSFKSADGDAPCITCPSFSSANAAHTSCSCNPGYFSSVSRQGECVPCLPNAACPAGNLVPNPGFWHSAAAPENLYACTPADACLNGDCVQGYSINSTLCGVCDVGYTKTPDGSCVSCPAPQPGFVVLIGFIVVALLGFVTFLSTSPPLPGVTIWLNVLQMAGETALVPRPVSRFLNAFSLDLGFLLPGLCLVSLPFFASWIVRILAPIFLLIGVYLVLFITSCGKACGAGREKFITSLWAGLFTVVGVTYILVAKTALSIFSCSAPINGEQLLIADRSIVCYSPQHIPFVALALVVLIVFCLLVPVVLLLAIARPACLRRIPCTRSCCCCTVDTTYLTDAYRDGAKPWEVAVLARRFAFSCIAQIGAEYFTYSLFPLVMVAGAALVSHTKVRPFGDDLHNTAETWGLSTLLMCCILRLFQGELYYYALNRGVQPTPDTIYSQLPDYLVVAVLVGYSIALVLAYRQRIAAFGRGCGQGCRECGRRCGCERCCACCDPPVVKQPAGEDEENSVL